MVDYRGFGKSTGRRSQKAIIIVACGGDGTITKPLWTSSPAVWASELM